MYRHSLKRQKLVAQSLSMAMALFILAGCASNTAPSSSAANTAPVTSASNSVSSEPKEPATITTLIAVGTMPPEDNVILQEIRKQSGVDLQVIATTQADFESKKATLTAAKQLPDLIPIKDRTELLEKQQNGVIIPLDELLKEYGQDILANKADVLEGSRLDGSLYAVPQLGSEGSVPYMLAIRKDWLDKLSLPMPQTMEEFYTTMKAFTENDPDGNGKNDTIGFGMGPNNVSMGIFEAYGINPIGANLNDGKIVPAMLHKNYMDAINMFRKLYQEGLMEPDFATIPWMQCLEKLWNGKYGAFVFTPVGTTNNWMSRYTEDPKPTFEYTILKSDKSSGGAWRPTIELTSLVAVNSQCKDPAAAVQLLNFFVTEAGNDLSILGVEGKHYKNNDDGSISYLPPYDTDLAQQRNEGGYAYVALMDRMDSAALKTFNKTTSDAIQMGIKSPLEYPVLFERPQIELDSGSILTDIEKEAFASLVVTKGNVEEEYQSYVDKWRKSGGEDWITQATEIYNKQAK